MAAAATAVVAAARNSTRRKTGNPILNSKDPVSFHLQLQLTPDFEHEGMNSVAFLRLPLKRPKPDTASSSSDHKKGQEGKADKSKIVQMEKSAGTRFEVLIKRYVSREPKESSREPNESSTVKFSPQLLIATEKRLFMVSKKERQPDQKDHDGWADSKLLEIVDSIPLEEVLTIRKHDEPDPDPPTDFLQKCFKSTAGCMFERNEVNSREDAVKTAGNRKEWEEKLESQIEEINATDFKGYLKITTKRDGFNRGASYYFIFDEQTFCAPTEQNAQRIDLDRVRDMLQSLADRRRRVYNREHRIQFLQKHLQKMWDSGAFNICVLFLIVSNFVFTVQQLENKDPARQPYFESIDLAYTIIFCVGILSPPRPHAQYQVLAFLDNLNRGTANQIQNTRSPDFADDCISRCYGSARPAQSSPSTSSRTRSGRSSQVVSRSTPKLLPPIL
jgi:hypothetical protein